MSKPTEFLQWKLKEITASRIVMESIATGALTQEHIALNYATTTSFHILHKSSFTYHLLIRR
jgi:type VI protein secretion system component Hcp